MRRKDFVDPVLWPKVNQTILQGKEIPFLPTDWRIPRVFGLHAQDYIECFGVLPCGSKATLRIMPLPLYFDVLCPRSYAEDASLIAAEVGPVQRYERVDAFPLNTFALEPRQYVRVHFARCEAYDASLKKATKYTTASDDSGYCLVPKLARMFRWNTCAWNMVSAYARLPAEPYKTTVSLCCRPEDLRPCAAKPDAWYAKPLQMEMAWDIETYTSVRSSGDIPPPDCPNTNIFMICAAFYWAPQPNPIYLVCICDTPIDLANIKAKYACPLDVVIVNSERDLVLAFAQVWGRMQPDVATAFNGGGFDWPQYRDRLRRHGAAAAAYKLASCTNYDSPSEESVLKYSFKEETVKITAELSHKGLRAIFPGCLDTDCMVVFKRLYPRSEVNSKSSLNHYLKVNGLGSKEDLHYQTMFEFYAEARASEQTAAAVRARDPNALAEFGLSDVTPDEESLILGELLTEPRANMAEVARYCLVDCTQCRALYFKRTVTADAREVAGLCFMTLYDSFYRADGGKVRNFVGSYCLLPDFNVAYSTRCYQSGAEFEFPGGYVRHPIYGLHTDYPTAALDAASLYPSIMMALNFSPETTMLVQGPADEEYAQRVRALGYTLTPIAFTAFELVTGGTPIAREIRGYVVRHNDRKTPADPVNPALGRDPLPREKMGLFPHIQTKLFAMRAEVKKPWAAICKFLEHIDYVQEENERQGRPATDYTGLEAAHFKDTGFAFEDFQAAPDQTAFIAEMKYKCEALNSRQKAIKVYMNTFYGEQGNRLSSIYKMLVAGAITSTGQELIKFVAQLLMDRDYKILYGDTDSVYISCSERYFAAAREVYLGTLQTLGLPLDRAGALQLRRQEVDTKHSDYSALVNEWRPRYTECTESGNEAKDAHGVRMFAGFCAAVVQATQQTQATSATLYALREEFWTLLVQIMRRNINGIRDLVNHELYLRYGNRYLTMAYEEVLMPTCLLGKKKYFGIPHLERENFHLPPDKLFIKGIDFIKQGQTGTSKEIGYAICASACDVTCDLELKDIVLDQLNKLVATKWRPEQLQATAKYKPLKKNVRVHRFHERMTARYLALLPVDPVAAAQVKPPEPGEPFYYVIVRKPTHDARGARMNTTKGDQMEYTHVFVASLQGPEPMELDYEAYLSGSFVGLLARFLTYLPEFHVGVEGLVANAIDKELKKRALLLSQGKAPPKPAKHSVDVFIIERAKKFVKEQLRARQPATDWSKVKTDYRLRLAQIEQAQDPSITHSLRSALGPKTARALTLETARKKIEAAVSTAAPPDTRAFAALARARIFEVAPAYSMEATRRLRLMLNAEVEELTNAAIQQLLAVAEIQERQRTAAEQSTVFELGASDAAALMLYEQTLRRLKAAAGARATLCAQSQLMLELKNSAARVQFNPTHARSFNSKALAATSDYTVDPSLLCPME